MPTPSTLFKNKEFALATLYSRGNQCLVESASSGGGNFGLRDAAYFCVQTGSSDVADITPGQATNVMLVPDDRVPLGCRCYVTRLDVGIQGSISWSCTSPSGVPYMSLVDSLGFPIAYLPFNAMRGASDYTFPDSAASAPLLLGESSNACAYGAPIATFTYNSSTGVITASAAIFTASAMIGVPVTILDGTGKGQSAIVTANTTTTLTLNLPFTNTVADHSSTAKDTILAVWYQPLAAYTDTTHVTLSNAAGTPFTANVLDNGYNLLGVYGASSGSVRSIIANTTAGACTLNAALNTAMNTSTTLVHVSNENNLFGAMDMGIGEKWAASSLNKGLQIAVNLQSGTSPLGSAARVFVEGFFAV